MVGIFAYAFQTKEYVMHSGQSRTVQSISIECLLVDLHACLGAQIFLLRVKISPKNRSTVTVTFLGTKLLTDKHCAREQSQTEQVTRPSYELLRSRAATTPQRACEITFTAAWVMNDTWCTMNHQHSRTRSRGVGVVLGLRMALSVHSKADPSIMSSVV